MVERQGATVLSAADLAQSGALRGARAPAAATRPSSGTCADRWRRCCSAGPRSSIGAWSRATGAGGLYHLLVVSGLHVVLEAGLVLFVLSLAGVEGKPRDLVLLAAVFLAVLVGGANPPGRARGTRGRRLPRDAPARAADRLGAGDRPLGPRPRPGGAGGDLLGRDGADLRGGRRDRALHRADPVEAAGAARSGCGRGSRPPSRPSARRRPSSSGGSISWRPGPG